MIGDVLLRQGLIPPAEAPASPQAPEVFVTPSAEVPAGQVVEVWFDGSRRAGFAPDDPAAKTGLVAYMTQTAGPTVTVTETTTAFTDSKKTFPAAAADTAYTFDCWVEDTNFDPPVPSIVKERTYTTPPSSGGGSSTPLGDGGLATFESRLKNPNVLWGWVMDDPVDPYAAIGGTGFDENAGAGGSSVPTRSIVNAPALMAGINTGKVMRLRFPLSESGVGHTQYVGYGQYCRRRFGDMDPNLPNDLRRAFFRYCVYLPANFHPYDGGKLPSLFGQPPSYPLAGAQGMSSGSTYNEYSWWAGIMFIGPSMLASYGGAYTGDSNLDHIRVQPYVYAKQIHGVTFSQASVTAGLRGWNVKLKPGLNQDPTAAETSTGTGTGAGNMYLVRGAWNTMEQEVILNSSGAANGHLRMWVNGVLGLNLKCIKWANDAYNTTAVINALMLDTFFGGPKANSAAQEMFFDDFVLSSAYVGPRSGA